MIVHAFTLTRLGAPSIVAVGALCLPSLAVLTASILPALSRQTSRQRQTLVAGVVLVAVTIGGGLLSARLQPQAGPNDVSQFIGVGPTRVRGIVSADREETTRALLLRVSVQSVLTDSGPHVANGTLLVRAPLSLGYDVGDLIEVAGKLVVPPHGPGFDYQTYLAEQGVHAEMLYPGTHLLARNQGDPWQEGLAHLRERLANGITSVLPEPEGSLGAGLALGASRVIDPTLRAELSDTGAAWLITGAYRIVLLGVFVSLGFGWLVGRRLALAASLPAMLGYAVLIGFQPSDVRALVVGTAFVAALLLGRPHTELRTLTTALAFMLLPFSSIPLTGPFRELSPFAAAFGLQSLGDASFLIGLAVVGALLVGAEAMTRALGGLLPGSDAEGNLEGIPRVLVGSVVVGAIAIFTPVPVILAASRQSPLTAQLAGLLLTPLAPVLILISLAAALAGALWHPLALVAAPVAYPLLALMVLILHLCSVIPTEIASATSVAALAPVAVYGLFATQPPSSRARQRALFSLLRSKAVHLVTVGSATVARERLKRTIAGFAPAARRWEIPSVFLVACLALTSAASAGIAFAGGVRGAGDPLRLTILDVGAGNAMLIESSGRRILIDGGPPGQATLRALDGRLAPWDRSLDLIVVTDRSDGNVGGLPGVLSHYRVGALLDAAAPATATKPYGTASRDLDAAWQANGVAAIPRQPSVFVRAGSARLVVRLAGASALTGPTATVMLEFGARRLLLSGDQTGSEPADVRILPETHIGASTYPPKITVLETGLISHASADLAAVPSEFRQALLYRTQENGAIVISTDGKRIRVIVSRGPKLGVLR